MDLTCRTSTIGDVTVLGLIGEVDLSSVPMLQAALGRLIADRVGEVVMVDLDGLSVLDDTGMGILLGAAGRARQQGGDLVLVCANPRLRDRFEASGLARAIEVRDRLTP